MARLLTASDRSALIKLASSLPAGDKNRRALLAMLKVGNDRAFIPAMKKFGQAVGVTLDDREAAALSKELAEMLRDDASTSVRYAAEFNVDFDVLGTGKGDAILSRESRRGDDQIEWEETFDYPNKLGFHIVSGLDFIEWLTASNLPRDLEQLVKDNRRAMAETLSDSNTMIESFYADAMKQEFPKNLNLLTKNVTDFVKDETEDAVDYIFEDVDEFEVEFGNPTVKVNLLADGTGVNVEGRLVVPIISCYAKGPVNPYRG